MFWTEFYPTPPAVVSKMLEWIQVRWLHVLEPSAWKGDILDAISRAWCRNLYAIETDENLRGILRSKGYRVIHDDFITYPKELSFDLIVMNPPFSNGDEHFLKAWDLVWDGGTVICLLNSETLLNPFSERRKLIAKVIADNGGQVVTLGNCFSGSERDTDVQVSMVRISKPVRESYGFEGFESETVDFSEISSTELASRDAVDTICRQYAIVKDTFAEGYALMAKAKRIGCQISDNYQFKPFEIAAGADSINDAVSSAMVQLKIGVWEKIAKELKLERYMTDKVRQDFRDKMKEQGAMAVTPENIRIFVQAIVANSGRFLEDCVVEVFDQFTKYHEHNREHVEGWKTNSAWKVQKRVVMPYWAEVNYNGSFCSYNKRTDDVDRAMCFLTGKRFDDIRKISDVVWECEPGEKRRTEFFYVRPYKKGTLHLEFADESLRRDFNMLVASKRNWLPAGERDEYESEKRNAWNIGISG